MGVLANLNVSYDRSIASAIRSFSIRMSVFRSFVFLFNVSLKKCNRSTPFESVYCSNESSAEEHIFVLCDICDFFYLIKF